MQIGTPLARPTIAAAVEAGLTIDDRARHSALLREQKAKRWREALRQSQPAPFLTLPRIASAAMLLLAMLLIAIGVATAQEFSGKDITVTRPWARATPGGTTVGAAYFQIKAAAGKGDRLVGVRSAIAGTVEVHSHAIEDGVAKMRRIDGLAIKGGESVALKPGGYHVMLMDLKKPLKEGERFKLTLSFEKAGDVEVEASVEPIGAKGPRASDNQPASEKNTGGHKH